MYVSPSIYAGTEMSLGWMLEALYTFAERECKMCMCKMCQYSQTRFQTPNWINACY